MYPALLNIHKHSYSTTQEEEITYWLSLLLVSPPPCLSPPIRIIMVEWGKARKGERGIFGIFSDAHTPVNTNAAPSCQELPIWLQSFPHMLTHPHVTFKVVRHIHMHSQVGGAHYHSPPHPPADILCICTSFYMNREEGHVTLVVGNVPSSHQGMQMSESPHAHRQI